MKYCSIAAIVVAVFFLGKYLPPGHGAWFYATQSLWSLVVVMSVLSIERTKLTKSISGIEITIMLLNLAACIEYPTSATFYYDGYPATLNVLNFIVFLALIFGSPWANGIIRRLQELRNDLIYSYASGYRLIQADAISYRERRGENGFRCQ